MTQQVQQVQQVQEEQAAPVVYKHRPRSSGLCLEIKRSGSLFWFHLKSSEPYNRNKPVSISDQVKQLETCRDNWVTHGTRDYRTAEYRIGEYRFAPELGGYVWVPYVKPVVTSNG